MIYSILSDIHGNLEALQAVLDDPAFFSVDRIVCLGDIVGYGANPRECIDLVRHHQMLCIAGNHDWAAAGKLDPVTFNAPAREALAWTAAQLDPEHLQFLGDLPLTWEEELFMVSHASPRLPDHWNYILTRHDAFLNLSVLRQSLCFVGHSHVPKIFILREAGELDERPLPPTVEVRGQNKRIINVGSVGQPRDHNPAAAFGILDTQKRIFSFRRVSYDIGGAQAKIRAAGLPRVLAERIEAGW